MPAKPTVRRSRKAKPKGKMPIMKTGEMAYEETYPLREGKGGARSPRRAVATPLPKTRGAQSKKLRGAKAQRTTKKTSRTRKARPGRRARTSA